MAPGTVTACTEVVSMRLMPWPAYHSAVAALGARPQALSAISFLRPGLAISAKQSPPMPVICGSTTHSTATVAMAASTALPPWRSVSMAVSVAAGWEVAHIARRPYTGERPGKWKLRIVGSGGVGRVKAQMEGAKT